MVGTLVNNMTQCEDGILHALTDEQVIEMACEDGILHALTDEQVIEMALAAPPEGASITIPWLLDRPAGVSGATPISIRVCGSCAPPAGRVEHLPCGCPAAACYGCAFRPGLLCGLVGAQCAPLAHTW